MSTKHVPTRNRVLMVDPQFFDIQYSINPFMRDEHGNLKKIDKAKAREQWNAVADAYRGLGLEVTVLPGRPNLPDMVFAANQSFPYWSLDKGVPAVILARMESAFRKPEVPFFAEWYEGQHYQLREISDSNLTFEGHGDVLIQGQRPLIWAASGPRTSPAVAAALRETTRYEVVSLTLRHLFFSHLATCFSILNDDTVAYFPGGFDEEDRAKIERGFSKRIEVGLEECRASFAGNCHSPDGKHVLLQRGASEFCRALVKNGFEPIELETSEYIKAGGSVFCMKMMAY